MADEGGSFTLQVITPKDIVFEGVVQAVNVPGFEGQFGVLPGHVPYIAALRPGLLSFEHEGEAKSYVLGHGFAEVGEDTVRLMTARYEDVGSVDIEAVTKQMQGHEKVMLEKEPNDPAYLDARAHQEMCVALLQSAADQGGKS